MIDLLLVLNALLLALISPQTQASPIAFYLPFILLGIVLATASAAYRGESLPPLHRTVAFGLALYGISGVMKGPISLSLLAPLALISFPIMTTSQALLVQGLAGVRPKLLPRWFSERGYTQGSFSFLLLLLSSALALGATLAVHCSPAHGLLVVGIVPVLIAAHLSRRKVSTWLTRCYAEGIDDRCFLFDVGFHNLTLHEAAARAEQMLLAPERSHMIVTVNSVSLLKSRKDKTLLEIYRRADLVTADGVGIVWASRLLGLPLKGRVTGIDLAQSLLERASVNGYRVFLLGGRKGVAERAARRLEKRFSGLDIVGTHHGYFDEAKGLLAAIKEAHPQILLVGMGVPKQERWMLKHVKELSVPLMIGVGGAFDVFSDDCPRAPAHWQRLGLEWLYRLLHEPQRIKEALAIPHFIGRVLAARAAVNLSTFIDLPGAKI
jgi:N-acetylglucosaminyldiphosphoundecaprenol N-acetyl-beta-D-mannosaminyltransferase